MLKYIRYNAKKFLYGAGAAVVAVIVMGYAGYKGPINDFLAIGAIAAGLLGGYGYFSRKK